MDLRTVTAFHTNNLHVNTLYKRYLGKSLLTNDSVQLGTEWTNNSSPGNISLAELCFSLAQGSVHTARIRMLVHLQIKLVVLSIRPQKVRHHTSLIYVSPILVHCMACQVSFTFSVSSTGWKQWQIIRCWRGTTVCLSEPYRTHSITLLKKSTCLSSLGFMIFSVCTPSQVILY
jgi:hypothetical protein